MSTLEQQIAEIDEAIERNIDDDGSEEEYTALSERRERLWNMRGTATTVERATEPASKVGKARIAALEGRVGELKAEMEAADPSQRQEVQLRLAQAAGQLDALQVRIGFLGRPDDSLREELETHELARERAEQLIQTTPATQDELRHRSQDPSYEGPARRQARREMEAAYRESDRLRNELAARRHERDLYNAREKLMESRALSLARSAYVKAAAAEQAEVGQLWASRKVDRRELDAANEAVDKAMSGRIPMPYIEAAWKQAQVEREQVERIDHDRAGQVYFAPEKPEPAA